MTLIPIRKTEKEQINELCKVLSCYQTDIKKKDQEIAYLRGFIDRHDLSGRLMHELKESKETESKQRGE